MQKQIFSILFTLNLVVLLSGCQGGTVNNKNVKTSDPNESSSSIGIDQEGYLQTPLSEADIAAYNGAISLEDKSFCDKIKDEDYKKQCKADLNDKTVQIEAIKNKDESKCPELSTKDLQEACKIQVDIENKKEEKIKKLKEQDKIDSAHINEIVKLGDYTKCNELSLDNYKKDCQYNILVNKAIKEQDQAWCDKATIASVRESCTLNYTMSTK